MTLRRFDLPEGSPLEPASEARAEATRPRDDGRRPLVAGSRRNAVPPRIGTTGPSSDSPAPMTAIISLSHVAMEFPALQGLGSVKALEDVSLDFREERVRGGARRIGACGKTTLLNVIRPASSPPTSGEVLHKGSPVSGPGKDRGVVFQKHALLPLAGCGRGTPSSGSSSRGVASAQRRATARENLALVGLSDFEHYPHLSALGRHAAAGRSRPGADLRSGHAAHGRAARARSMPSRARAMQELILDVWRKTGKVVFFITHSVGGSTVH